MPKTEKEEILQNAWPKIIAKAWEDPQFKQELLKNPRAVFKEYGFELKTGVEMQVNEATDKKVFLVLPPKPSGELTEAELKRIAGGDWWSDFLCSLFPKHC